MARALGNLIGNCVATAVVVAWEGDLDRDKARRVLDGAELRVAEPRKRSEPRLAISARISAQPFT
jgi:Na+/H+-dicarboxylate symporter